MTDDNRDPAASLGSVGHAIAGKIDDFSLRARAWRDERGYPTAGEMLDEASELLGVCTEKIAALTTCESWLQGQVAKRDSEITFLCEKQSKLLAAGDLLEGQLLSLAKQAANQRDAFRLTDSELVALETAIDCVRDRLGGFDDCETTQTTLRALLERMK